ncbi:MAG: hypothetical protein HOA86_03185 [Gammaproteobacteria bacterium]|jgi:hypothetical protein|nr:hypothetical protein [Gammaproteobacteria bacterium]MBT7523718.1 hypothetical protein [Gammaproteobacteria bacterium]MBT7814232.1 hypothetical protein [Gammaproteobacteria bacterium]
MLNEKTKKVIAYNEIKNKKLKNKILKKIENIQKKINQNYNVYNIEILKNKLYKLKTILKKISMKPKEKNRLKEIERINIRVREYKKELFLLSKDVRSEYIESNKIYSKINKLEKRKRVLEKHIFSKKPVRKSPLLIRYYLRKHREVDEFIT